MVTTVVGVGVATLTEVFLPTTAVVVVADDGNTVGRKCRADYTAESISRLFVFVVVSTKCPLDDVSFGKTSSTKGRRPVTELQHTYSISGLSGCQLPRVL